MEVKAGMNMPRLARQFGERISFCGNIDVRILEANDHAALTAELAAKIPPTLATGAGYILASDHSIPPAVNHDTLHDFFSRAGGYGG